MLSCLDLASLSMRSTPSPDVAQPNYRHKHKASMSPVKDQGSRHRNEVAKTEPKQSRVMPSIRRRSLLFPHDWRRGQNRDLRQAPPIVTISCTRLVAI